MTSPSAAPTSPDSPRDAYRARLSDREAEAAVLERRDRALSNGRLLAFLVAVAAFWVVVPLGEHLLWIILLPLALFIALVFRHDRAIKRLQSAREAVGFYTSGVNRLDGAWTGKGQTGARHADSDHPYAADLDILGRGSLFELLCTARTRAGQDTLAAWLLAPAPPETIRARQAAVEELRPRLDLREDLHVLGAHAPSGQQSEGIAEWAADPPVEFPGWLRPVCWALAAVNVAAALAAWPFGQGAVWLLLTLVASGLLVFPAMSRVKHSARGAEAAGRDLVAYGRLLERIERETFRSTLLTELLPHKGEGAVPASAAVAALDRLIQLRDSSRNVLFAPVAALLLWNVQIAISLEAWRREHGERVQGWIEAVGRFEALCAFATAAYEHPGDVFPEIVEDGPELTAEGIGHPLLLEEKAVRNDVHLGTDLRLLLVSGSNMSGKSTLLRSIGVNVALAQAGGVVRARRMRLSPLAVGASLRPQDSLQGGISRFYAEVLRVRNVVSLTRGETPVLFLLDEILSGTNSHDRRIGSEGVVRALLAAGAVGLITTHDLALTEIAEPLGSQARNVHFEDQMEDGRMSFDYRLRPGVVTHSNALELMRAVGLEV
jgi:hypothetical protein